MNKLWRSLVYGFSPMIVVLAVSIVLLRANAPLVTTVVGISTPTSQIPVVPQKDERIHSIEQWAIPRTSEFKYSVHVALDKTVIESDPRITEVNIDYVYLGYRLH